MTEEVAREAVAKAAAATAEVALVVTAGAAKRAGDEEAGSAVLKAVRIRQQPTQGAS